MTEREHRQRQQEGKLDTRRYLSLLQDNTNFLCAVVILVTLTTLVIAYAMPKRYEASSTVFIEHNVISDLVKGIAITPSIDSKLRILKVSLLSRPMLMKVAAELDMDLNVSNITEQEKLIESMRARTQISHDEKKGLFFISYTDSSPYLARDFVNTITRLYIEENTAAKRKESYDATSFLSDQIQVFQKRIESAQQAIDSFKAEKGMYLGLNEQILRQQIKDNEKKLEDLRIQKTELKAKLDMLTPGSVHQEELRSKELELQRLLSIYTDRHPAAMRAKEDIKNLKELIAEEEKNPGTNSPSLEHQKATLELASVEEFEKNLREELTQNIKDLQELPSIRTELAALEQRKNNETMIYEQLVARLGQSEVSKQMELQDKSVSFRIIDAAVLPTQYIWPKRPLMMLLGIFGGLALGVGILVLYDLLRAKIRSPKDVEKYHAEVIVRLPRMMPQERLDKIKRQHIFMGITAGFLVVVSVLAALEASQISVIESAIYRISRLLSA